MNESGKDRPASRCEEFDSVRVEGAGREIGGSIRDEGGGGGEGGGRERDLFYAREDKAANGYKFRNGAGRGERRRGRG